MDKAIPSWIDENFVIAALQGGPDKPNVSVLSFKVTPPAGLEGFSSEIFRLQVTYRQGDSTQEQSKSLVIKVPDASGLVFNVIGSIICEKEFVCYNVLLPKMMERVSCDFAPTPFHSEVDKVVIMENLKPEYHSADIKKQLDFEHCKVVVATIAKYHASSVALYSENTELIRFVGKESFFPEGGPLKGWVELGTRTLGEELSKMEGCEKYADFFLSRVDTIWDVLVKCMKPQPDRFNVLNHGDMWINNLFFKYNEAKEVEKVKFIDFQVSRYNVPAMDLVQFMYSCAQHDVREHRQQELYSHYLEVLNSTLEATGCSERLSPQQFKEDMRYATPWFIGTIVFSIPLVFAAGTEDEQGFDGYTREDFVSGKANSTILKVLHGKVLKSRLPHMVRQFLAYLES